MNFSDFNGVISQEVVEDEWEFSALDKESQHFSIVIQELLFGWSSSSTEFLLKEFEKFWILLLWNWLAGVNECILWACLCVRLRLADVLLIRKYIFSFEN